MTEYKQFYIDYYRQYVFSTVYSERHLEKCVGFTHQGFVNLDFYCKVIASFYFLCGISLQKHTIRRLLNSL